MPQKSIVWFKEVGKEDIPIVGGKGANLGEMTNAGFPVPPGFIVTAHAYFDFIKKNNLDKKITHLLNTVNYDDPKSLESVSESVQREIKKCELSSDLKLQIYSFYKELGNLG